MSSSLGAGEGSGFDNTITFNVSVASIPQFIENQDLKVAMCPAENCVHNSSLSGQQASAGHWVSRHFRASALQACSSALGIFWGSQSTVKT